VSHEFPRESGRVCSTDFVAEVADDVVVTEREDLELEPEPVNGREAQVARCQATCPATCGAHVVHHRARPAEARVFEKPPRHHLDVGWAGLRTVRETSRRRRHQRRGRESLAAAFSNEAGQGVEQPLSLGLGRILGQRATHSSYPAQENQKLQRQ
jgi:hypothetical protein